MTSPKPASSNLRSRSEIPTEFTWDAASIFATNQEWELAFRSVEERLPDLIEFRGRLSDGAATLADWFAAAEAASATLARVNVHAQMAWAVDSADQAAAGRLERCRSLVTRVAAATSFAEPELLAIGAERLREWSAEAPRLAHYNHYFEVLEGRRPHIRSAEVEEVISLAHEPLASAATVHGVLANAELRFASAENSDGDQFEVAQGTISSLLASPDRRVRESAWVNYADAHLELKNTMAACLATGIKRDVFMARTRRYRSSLEAALEPNHIPTAVFHGMLDTFRRSLPTWHRYWRIRRQALGLEELFVHDTRAVLTPSPTPVPFEQAVEWILDGVQPLGTEYAAILRRGVTEERWVDIYPNSGKRMGAFSIGSQGTRPFIFMSYSDDIFSMSTLAHEIGHSMHSYYSRRDQPYVYSGYGLFVAEVASNFHQALTRARLLAANPGPTLEIAVIEEAMANFHRYFFIMPSLARFELETHARAERGEPLNADSMNQLMADLLQEVYGQEVTLRPGDRERVGSTWAQFHSHLYSNFYVYQYATGIAGANWLAERIQAGQPGAAEAYLEFIRSGSSLYPLDALRLAGVDMTSPEPMERAFAVMGEMVDRLETLVARGQRGAAPG